MKKFYLKSYVHRQTILSILEPVLNKHPDHTCMFTLDKVPQENYLLFSTQEALEQVLHAIVTCQERTLFISETEMQSALSNGEQSIFSNMIGNAQLLPSDKNESDYNEAGTLQTT